MERLIQLQQWLKEKTEESKAAEQTLREDERQDEAAFQKIRGNVYGIFCAVADAARKQAAPEAFLKTSWRRSPRIGKRRCRRRGSSARRRMPPSRRSSWRQRRRSAKNGRHRYDRGGSHPAF